MLNLFTPGSASDCKRRPALVQHSPNMKSIKGDRGHVSHRFLPSWGLPRSLRSFSSKSLVALLVVISVSTVVARTFPVSSGTQSCSPNVVSMEIRYMNCMPTVVPAKVCAGRCETYSRPDPNHPDQLQRHCQCCREMGRTVRHVLVRCPSSNDTRRMESVRLQISVPRECDCRPCSS